MAEKEIREILKDNCSVECYDVGVCNDCTIHNEVATEIMAVMERENTLLKLTISRQQQTITELESPGEYTSTEAR